MSIGRTFRESVQKAYRSLEVGLDGLEPKPAAEGDPDVNRARSLDMSTLRYGTSFRLLKVRQALVEGQSIEDVFNVTKIDPWFLNQIKMLVDMNNVETLSNASLRNLKHNGFSDRQIGRMIGKKEKEIRAQRHDESVHPSYKVVDTCAAEFEAQTPYCYSTYDEENEISPLAGKKIMILGSGPNRIGQGIEFDYCCVQAVFGLKELGYKTIMFNCNQETLSPDVDIVDSLYFAPVTYEDVLNIAEFENPDGVLVQFGGQTPLKICNALSDAGVQIIGTSPRNIDLAENKNAKYSYVLGS